MGRLEVACDCLVRGVPASPIGPAVRFIVHCLVKPTIRELRSKIRREPRGGSLSGCIARGERLACGQNGLV
jgi:hypothetical protein